MPQVCVLWGPTPSAHAERFLFVKGPSLARARTLLAVLLLGALLASTLPQLSLATNAPLPSPFHQSSATSPLLVKAEATRMVPSAFGRTPSPAPSARTSASASVADTLVLQNNTLIPGNYLTTVPQQPTIDAVDPWSGNIFVTGWTGPSLVGVVNGSTHVLDRSTQAGARPFALYYDALTGDVYVGNFLGSNLTVLNGSTGSAVGSIPVGSGPETITGDSTGGTLYVGNDFSHNISVVSTSTGRTLRSIPLRWEPTDMAYDTWNGLLYVTNGGWLQYEPCSANVTVIDPTTGATVAIVPFATQCMEGVTFDPSNGDIFVTNIAGNISVINGATDLVIGTILIPGFAAPVLGDVDRANGRLYFADVGGNSAVIVNGTTRTFQGKLAAGTFPMDAVVDNRTQEVYLANQQSNNLTVISATLNRSIASIIFASAPGSITIDPLTGTLYVLDASTSTARAVSGQTELEVGALPLHPPAGYTGPNSIAFDSTNGDLYVSMGNAVQVINPTNGSVVKSIPTSPAYQANELVFDPANGYLFLAEGGGVQVINGATNTVISAVSIGLCGVPAEGLDLAHQQVYFAYQTCGGFNGVAAINATTFAVQATISTGASPDGVTADPVNGQVLVSNAGSGNVTIIDGSTHGVVGSIPTFPGPAGGCYSAANGLIYVADASGAVSVLNASTDTLMGNVNVGQGPITDQCDAPGGLEVISNTASGTLSFLAPAGIVPVLSSTVVSPRTATLYTGGHASLGASVSCTGGPCPSPATYQWALVNTEGTLNVSHGTVVNFTAGATPGTETVFVNATMNGRTVQSLPVTLTIVLPALSTVNVSPTSASISTGGRATFNATLGCIGGSCPAGATYLWSETNLLGTLTGIGTSSLTFTALATAGADHLFLNVSLNGVTLARGPYTVTISAPSTLTTVGVAPTTASLTTGGTQGFTATPGCTATCPAGTTYLWSMSRALGSLNTSVGSAVLFTAGTTAGTTRLFVNATLSGTTVQSAGVVIVIAPPVPTLTGVAISPASGSVSTGGSEGFSVSLTCTGGACPTGATYAWAVTSDGTLSSPTAVSTTFTAGSTAGTVRLFVNATLNGVTQGTSVSIQINQAPGSTSSTPTLFGMNAYLLIGLLVVVVVVVAAIATLMSSRKGRKPPVAASSNPPSAGQAPGAAAPAPTVTAPPAAPPSPVQPAPLPPAAPPGAQPSSMPSPPPSLPSSSGPPPLPPPPTD